MFTQILRLRSLIPSSIPFVFLLPLAILLLPGKAFAQSGTITGIVADTTGANVPNASITVLSEGTGVVRTGVASDNGYYSISLLTQGVYTVTFQANGYEELKRTGVRLEQAQVFRLDATLKIGSVSNAVEVTSQAPPLDRETNDVGTVVESKSILNTPLNARNAAAFVNLVPGTKTMNGAGGFQPSANADGRISISGGVPSANEWLMDGIADENQTSGGGAFAPSVDAMSEIHIVTHTPSAEYGRLAGGVVAYVSKSGTNEFHGSAWEFAQNGVFNSNDFFSKRAGKTVAPFNLNQYGVAVGGPVLKKRLFFFANWEGLRKSQQQRSFYTVPTDLQKKGDFSQTYNAQGQMVTIYDPLSTTKNSNGQYVRTAFQGNAIPSGRLNQVALAVASYYPEPNLPGNAYTGINNYLSSADTSYTRNDIGIRMDYYLTPTRQIAGRYTWDSVPSNFAQPYGKDNLGTPATSPTRYIRYSSFLSYSDALSPNLFTEVRVGVNQFGIDRTPTSAGFDATKLNLPASLNQQQQLAVFPYFSFSTTSPMGSTPGDWASQRGYAYELANSWTWIKSAHSIKAGWEGRLYQWNSVQGAGLIQFAFDQNWTKGPSATSSATNGYDFASFMLGNPASGTLYRYQNYEYSTYYYAGYVQDDWKVNRRLTANVGLRWDHELPTTARHNNIANFDPNVTATDNGINLTGGMIYPTVNGLSRGSRESTWDNWGPRAGLVYALTPTTVVRAGFGIYYLPTTGTFVRLSDTGFSSITSEVTTLDNVTPTGSLSNPFPQGIVQPTGSSLGALTGLGTSITGNLRNLVSGTSQQWSVNLQQQVGSWTVELGYTANHGLHLPANFSYHHLDQKYLALGSQLLQVVANPYASIISNGTLSASTVSQGTLLNYYPQFTGVSAQSNWAGSNYQAGSVRVQRKYSTGISLLGSYTWSKYLDNNLGNGANVYADSGSNSVQNWDDLKAEKAISTSSQPHALVVFGGYDIPGLQSATPLLRALTSKWRVNGVFSAYSGMVISVTANAPTFGGSRPNLIGNPRPSHPSVNNWLNSGAFQAIPAYTNGNAPRTLPNYFTQPTINLDSSISRTVSFADRYKAEFRVEAFNTLNSTIFGSPGTTFGNATFGIISSLRPGTAPRVLQFGFKGYF